MFCPVWAILGYVEQTWAKHSSDQLFVCFANPVRGKPMSKQCLGLDCGGNLTTLEYVAK